MHNFQRILFFITASTILLQGCGNAHDSLSVEAWSEVGKNLPPIETLKGELLARVTQPGTGKTVNAGDLVKIGIRKIYTNRATGEVTRLSTQKTIWLWVGQEPEHRDWRNLNSWGNLGSPRLRKLLIARAVGEKFEIKLEDTAEGFVEIPVYGFSLPLEKGYTLNPDAITWPGIKLGYSVPRGTPLAEIEILNSCPGHLYRRSGVLKQWGYVPNAFETNYKFNRQGTLRWSAVEGVCEPPAGNVRLEIGPIYFYKDRSELSLYNWTYSFRNLRPPTEYPEDYKSALRIKNNESLREVKEGQW